ncbi:hypothetical protein [Lysobacter capsici]|uniref:hypothetical protein n=1 Tax=Lysobacter capsici TaxID=435897 RepID=UPI0004536001|nr:hypothetical protein [Lysobacter capsici]
MKSISHIGIDISQPVSGARKITTKNSSTSTLTKAKRVGGERSGCQRGGRPCQLIGS